MFAYDILYDINYATLGPISNALARKYGAKRVVTLGGFILTVGCILNSFSNCTEYFLFSHSIVGGYISIMSNIFNDTTLQHLSSKTYMIVFL